MIHENDWYVIRSWTVRIGISIVIALMNAVLKESLSFCVRYERRWTRSKQERSYALLCYLSQLINTVVVLLVVRLRLLDHCAAIGCHTSSRDLDVVVRVLIQSSLNFKSR